MNLTYALFDPMDMTRPRYIGCSSRGMVRPHQHLTARSRGLNTHLGAWLRKLHRNGTVPVVLVLGRYPDFASALRDEVRLIALFRDCGLVNMTDGGEGTAGVRVSAEELARRRGIGMRNRECTATATARAAHALAMSRPRRHRHSDSRARTAAAVARAWSEGRYSKRVFSAEARERMREAAKRRWQGLTGAAKCDIVPAQNTHSREKE